MGSDGELNAAAFIICNADAGPFNAQAVPRAVKLILIANDAKALREQKVPIEYLRKPTPEGMTRALFLEHDWPVEKAKRLAVLAEGDRRKLWCWEALLKDRGVDVASATDEEFRQLVMGGAKDKRPAADSHPSLAAHQLLSGRAPTAGGVELFADDTVFAWTERNLGVLCGSVEDMLKCQEAACHADVLQRTGAAEEGVGFFAQTAASVRNTANRYDYKDFASPWGAAKETPEAGAVRESISLRKPWAWHAKRRLAATQERQVVSKPKTGRQRKVPTVKAKAKGKQAPERIASKP